VGEGLGGGADAVVVELDAADRGGLGSRGDEDAGGGEGLGAAALEGDLALTGTAKGAEAVVRRDAVLLEQAADAGGARVDGHVLARQHDAEVEGDVADADAVRGEGSVARFGELVARLEHGLARDAADAETGAAELRVLVDAGDVHAELGRADRCDVTARPGADDHQVVVAHLRAPWRQGLDAEEQALRIFEERLDANEELHGLATVDEAMVVAEGEVHHGTDL